MFPQAPTQDLTSQTCPHGITPSYRSPARTKSHTDMTTATSSHMDALPHVDIWSQMHDDIWSHTATPSRSHLCLIIYRKTASHGHSTPTVLDTSTYLFWSHGHIYLVIQAHIWSQYQPHLHGVLCTQSHTETPMAMAHALWRNRHACSRHAYNHHGHCPQRWPHANTTPQHKHAK